MFRFLTTIISCLTSLTLLYILSSYLLNPSDIVTTTPFLFMIESFDVTLGSLNFNLLPCLLSFVIISRLLPALLSLLVQSGFRDALLYDR